VLVVDQWRGGVIQLAGKATERGLEAEGGGCRLAPVWTEPAPV
jgi:hypothetical protein